MFENNYWSALYILRLILAAMPQYGYIHPDEFFQSVEVAAGEEFGVETYTAWEFTSKSPIRSRLPILITACLPLSLIRLIHFYLPYFSLQNPANLLKAYRIWMALLSFSVDYNVRKILIELKVFPQMYINCCMNVLASSFIMVVFASRTFSNSFELFLFAFLLRISICKFSSCLIKDIFAFALILTIGVFNRPTFLVFAFIPYIGFLLKKSEYNYLKGLKIILKTATFGVLFTIGHILLDSFYYDTITSFSKDISNTIHEKGISFFLTNNLTFTVLNFVKYNSNSENLAKHGIHPRITHLLINFPLLFAGFSIFALYDSYLRARKSTTVFWSENGRLKFDIVFFSWLVPLFSLSLFPHQEPRFLLPLIVPLVLLYASQFYHSKYMLTFLWIIPNLLLTLFFGCIHQAGVVPSILATQGKFVHPALNSNETVVAIFWRTYMPPRHLFYVPSQKCDTFNVTVKNDRCKKPYVTKFKIFDMKSSSDDDVLRRLGRLLNVTKKTDAESNGLDLEVFDYHTRGRFVLLYVPGSVVFGPNCTLGHFRLQRLYTYWPHFSGEYPPQIVNEKAISCNEPESEDCPYLPNIFYELYISSTFNVYNVTLY